MVETARRRPAKLGLPFTHWSIRKLGTTSSVATAAPTRHRCRTGRADRPGTGAADPALPRHHLSAHPDLERVHRPGQGRQAGPDRGSDVPVSRSCLRLRPVGPLSIRPCHGTCWAGTKHPDRLAATYHRYHGVRYFHGCYDLARDQLWGVLHQHKGGAHTLAALNSVRAARPDGAPIYVVLDNLSCNTTAAIRIWAAAHKV